MDAVVYALLKKQLGSKADLVDGQIPAEELPSYVDDIIEYASAEDFPIPGERGKIYLDTSTKKTYRWAGSQYVAVGGGGTEWTVITSDMTNDERKAALQNATLPFIIFTIGKNAYQFNYSYRDDFYFYNCLYTGTVSTISYKVNANGTFSSLGAIHSVTSLNTNVDDSHFPTSKAVVDYVHSYVTLSNISSGDVIPSSGSFWNSITKHYDVELNSARLHYMTEDDTNYQYGTMTMNGANIQLNLVTFNKTTHVVTFNTVTMGDYYTKSETDAAIQTAVGNAIGGSY